MAKKKSTKKSIADERSLMIEFIDGPKKGERLRLCNPPPVRARFAEPEWCAYEFIPPLQMRYIGDIKVPRLEKRLTIEFYDKPIVN